MLKGDLEQWEQQQQNQVRKSQNSGQYAKDVNVQAHLAKYKDEFDELIQAIKKRKLEKASMSNAITTAVAVAQSVDDGTATDLLNQVIPPPINEKENVKDNFMDEENFPLDQLDGF